MSPRTTELTAPLYAYLLREGVREPAPLRRLREATERALPDQARMLIAPEQGALLALLVELTGARRTFEAGVFTGYSTLAVALALPDDGVVVASDINRTWTGLGRPFWEAAGAAHRIDLRLAPAVATMDRLLAEGAAGTFDFVFVDADKTEYAAYYERALLLLRPGGLIAVDNVLWSGRPADDAAQDQDTRAIRAFNRQLRDDARVSIAMVPVADGLTLARKRG